MSHEIDETTGVPAIAYIGEKPWHGLGSELAEGATIEEWRVAAGLNWKVIPSTVEYKVLGIQNSYNDRKVLFRNDTSAPLSVVSKDYNIVQPDDILYFFEKLVRGAGFSLQTAGSLHGGRVIWAQANVGPEVKIMDDTVAPRLLLSTSFDSTVPTIAKFVAERVVCANTIAIALGEKGRKQVRISHASKFVAADVRAQLDLAASAFEAFVQKATKLANTHFDDAGMDAYLLKLLTPMLPADTATFIELEAKVRKSRTYKNIISLFNGGQIGTGQDAIRGSAYGALNAVTQYIDHEKGRNQSSRLSDAWFGMGGQLKERALELLAA